MKNIIFKIKIIFSTSLLILTIFTGCIEIDDYNERNDIIKSKFKPNNPLILPNWSDGDYHDYYGSFNKLNELNEKYENLTYLFSIGKSVLGKDIWCIRLTDEGNKNIKSSCLIDGCIHGNEWESGEACLYLAEFLLLNYGKNASVDDILENSDIYIVPLLNPDGRQSSKRWNDNGVDLNRNFDIFFGKIRGGCFRLGKLMGIIKIPYVMFPRLGLWFSNCGKRAFSEPEAQSIRDLTERISYKDFSFYVNCHTAVHTVSSVWITHKPPFQISQQEQIVIDFVFDWVEKNTEYETQNEPLKVGGTITDWCFKQYHIPSFCFEILSKDYEPFMGQGKHDNLVHWMKTTIPFFMFLLVNIDHLRRWEIPINQPFLPEGVPPNQI